jgi:CHASE2 domain-containing sensor protein
MLARLQHAPDRMSEILVTRLARLPHVAWWHHIAFAVWIGFWAATLIHGCGEAPLFYAGPLGIRPVYLLASSMGLLGHAVFILTKPAHKI